MQGIAQKSAIVFEGDVPSHQDNFQEDERLWQ